MYRFQHCYDGRVPFWKPAFVCDYVCILRLCFLLLAKLMLFSTAGFNVSVILQADWRGPRSALYGRVDYGDTSKFTVIRFRKCTSVSTLFSL